uniref:hydrolase 1, exosortase A system-associated n=1 Tax=Accumulibacter sp. TaxID=2053492 RepID=UPI0028C40373
MNFVEEAVLFSLGDDCLPGIVARPQTPLADARAKRGEEAAPAGLVNGSSTDRLGDTRQHRASCGVLIVVGGPQVRVGSHRQFLLLSRRLASEGYPAMRFDCRGMGDASGAMRSFEEISADIGAAIEAFQRSCPTLRRVVLWGLCDAASAALLYVQATADERISGLALLNPWVRSETSLAQTHIKHYYGQRLLEGEFWRKLLSGKLEILASLRGLLNTVLLARRSRPQRTADMLSFQDRMAEGWRRFSGGLLLVLSGQDYTAKEFLEFTATNPAWTGLIEQARVRRIDLADADHTFSSRAWRAQVEEETLAWLDTL